MHAVDVDLDAVATVRDAREQKAQPLRQLLMSRSLQPPERLDWIYRLLLTVRLPSKRKCRHYLNSEPTISTFRTVFSPAFRMERRHPL
ncbi:hypothetical protein C8039_18960 [Halogeometricum sp. wsp3]|nr:hypothetical protein C8039_18960 [Halogeometricum sp. wsp3]